MVSEELAQLRTRMAETIGWYELERPLVEAASGARKFKCGERLRVDESYAADHPERAAQDVVQKRAELLAEAGWRVRVETPVPRGRVLFLLTARNLMDGAAQLASNGFFGELNFPPCDLWIDFWSAARLADGGTEPVLACWIPEAFLQVAQQGVDVNPEECLVWADQLAPDFVKAMLG